MLKHTALLAAASLSLAACQGFGAPHPLDGTNWRLVNVETSGTSTSLTTELSSRHTLIFEGGGRLAMQLDCNRGNADWSASQPRGETGSISIGPVASTRALCPRPTFGEELAAELPGATSFTLLDDRSELVIRAESADYVFARD